MPRDGRRKNKAPTTFGPTVLSTERALAAYSALSLEELNQIPHSWRSYYDSSYPVWKVSELEKASRLGFDAYNRARLQAVSQEQELARAQAAARAAKDAERMQKEREKAEWLLCDMVIPFLEQVATHRSSSDTSGFPIKWVVGHAKC